MCGNGAGVVWNGMCEEHVQVSNVVHAVHLGSFSVLSCVQANALFVYSSLTIDLSFLHWNRPIDSAAGWFVCGMETLLLGGLCATVAYLIGQFVDGLIAKS